MASGEIVFLVGQIVQFAYSMRSVIDVCVILYDKNENRHLGRVKVDNPNIVRYSVKRQYCMKLHICAYCIV